MKIINNLRIVGFRKRLFMVFAASAAAAITLSTVIGLTSARKAISDSVRRDLQVIALRTAGELDQYFSGKTDMVIAARELLSYPNEDKFKIELMLKRLSLEFLHFKGLAVYDISNRLIASSSPDQEASLSEDVFNTSKNGKTYKSPMLFTKESLPYIRIAVPLFWQGEVFRILEADIDILDVWNKIDDIRVGSTGHASILSQDGVFLADLDKSRVLNMRRWRDSVSSDTSLAGERGTLEARDRNGKYLFVSYAGIPATEWKLVITQERSEALHFLTTMIYQALFIIVISLIAAYYISSWLSIRISRPVEELHKGVQEISRGNFGYEIPPLHGEEFSTLASGFNSMTKSLADKEKTEKELSIAERLAAVGRLAADVAHEINNPLAIMKNYIYIIGKKKMKEDDPNQLYLKIIDGEIDRVAKIIRSFNEFYRGAQFVPLEEVDILKPLREIIEFCRMDMEEKGITIKESLPKSGKVMADRDKLKQVFLNLIKNAAEAMTDGGLLTIEAAKVEGKMRISVADTGMGIKEEHLRKIFDPFFSTKGVKGTGLGLSVSYGIIKNMNGDIEVESEEGKGATFRVVLPIA